MAKKSSQQILNYLPFVPQESIDLVLKTLKTAWIGGDGPRVKEFESEVGKIIKTPNVLAVSSGTIALQLALRLAGVRDSEVITSPMTCFASSAAIALEGGTPVWTDIDPETGNIDPYDIARRITKKTRAIMVVHWGGSPADIDFVRKIAEVYQVPVIEDAAQALGSEYGGKPIGSHSEFVAFSTQAIKIINTADGGFLVTQRKSDMQRAKALRWYGIDRDARKWNEYDFWEYPISEIGYKAQMTDVAASLGLGQIPYLQKHLAHRRRLAKLYQEALTNAKTLRAQKVLPQAVPNYWTFTVICESTEVKHRLRLAMAKINVRVEEAHRRNDQYPVFRQLPKVNLPGVDHFDEHHLIIPVGHWVSQEDAKRIAQVLTSF